MNQVVQGDSAETPTHPPSWDAPSDAGVPTSPPIAGQSPPPSGGDELEPTDQRPDRGSRHRALLALGVVLLVAVAGGTGYMVGSRDGQSAESAAPSGAPMTNESRPEGAPPAVILPVPDSVPVDPASLTETQQRAAAAATKYLEWSHSSRADVIDQLTRYEYADEIFTLQDAVAGVDSLGVDWVENARLTAQSYVDDDGWSRLSLLDQITGATGFTVHQATTAVDSMDIDWDEQAVRYVQAAVERDGVSRNDLLRAMADNDSEDFPRERATAAIDSQNIDWDAEALQAAQHHVEVQPDITCDELLYFLTEKKWDWFEPDRAQRAADQVGVC